MRARYLEEREVEALRRAMLAEDWLIMQVAQETGLRVGDVVALRWEDIRGRKVTYRAQKTGKLGCAELSAGTAAWLARRRRRRASGWVFPSPKKPGAHITRQAVWWRMKRACKRSGVDEAGASPHSLRKVFAVAVYREDGLRAAQEALQHDRAEVTELYALSDWSTDAHADEPLLRRDMVAIAREVARILGLDKTV